ncbi:putative uncharacterized protein DDB_G0289009 isoform X2 [Temnothorax curvispinosus]|uniref:Uncharacterized protein n=1 Tax=Temnothorax curvispinosus TaxID=300111 RepID=A0A6J1QK24_9HYME|nr:putative uncharacterized protein DDB_G0289009 isoform X2 [Temnothorax curvispinosus]
MEKIHIIIKPSVDGLTNEFDNDNIENNQNSYCENELEDNNDDSNTQGNTTVPLENLFEEIPSSDAEDSYVGTTQETPEYTESFPALASIKKRKLDDMKRDMSNKNMPFKQSGQKNKQHINVQFRNTNNFNKNCNVSEEKSDSSKPTINSSKQLQDIAINCDTSSEENECPTDKDDFGITQRKIVNTGTKTKEKSAVNVLRKKMNKPIQIRGENVQFNSDCAKTFPQTKKNYSMSDKVLNFATLAKSKTELVDVMKADIDEKHAIEVNILNMQLKREILQVQLIEKEIAIKECILQRVKKTETLEDIENLNM